MAIIYNYLPPRFSVSPSSGVISTIMPIDHEERAVYHLTLIARDGGGTLTSPNQANTLIVVEVIDINDHTPQCFPSSTVVTLAENTAFPNFLTISVSSTINMGHTLASFSCMANSAIYYVPIKQSGACSTLTFLKDSAACTRQLLYICRW